MNDELRAAGAHIDDWRFCPHHPDGNIPEFTGYHPWRKPEPGMLTDLMDHWDVDKDASLLVGDQESDLLAATRAGIAPYRFTGGNLLDFISPLLSRSANLTEQKP